MWRTANGGGSAAAAAAAAASPAAPSTPGGTTTPQRRATVDILVREARNLLAMDANGLSDPYAVVTVGSKAWKTSVQPRTLNPSWHETFRFEAAPGETLPFYMSVELWDSDKLGTDDFLGSVMLPLAAQQDYKLGGWFSLTRGSFCTLLSHTTHRFLQTKSTAPAAKSRSCVIFILFFCDSVIDVQNDADGVSLLRHRTFS
jgi:hypothetical protein